MAELKTFKNHFKIWKTTSLQDELNWQTPIFFSPKDELIRIKSVDANSASIG
jgi:hypothetical protein